MKYNASKSVAVLSMVCMLCLGALSCKKSETQTGDKQNQPEPVPTLVTAPEARVEEDSRSGGVYKGVFVGSTGYVKIVMQDGIKSVVVTMDGVTKNLDLITLSPSNWTSGQELTQAVFAKDNWTVRFSVKGEGGDPDVKVEIPNHEKIIVTIVKEKSSAQVKVFEGNITYEGKSANSIFNFVVSGELFVGQGRMPGENDVYSMYGILVNDTKIQGSINGATVSGKIDAEMASGTIVTSNATADWNSKRTL